MVMAADTPFSEPRSPLRSPVSCSRSPFNGENIKMNMAADLADKPIENQSPCMDEGESFALFTFTKDEDRVKESYDSLEENGESELEEYAIWTPKSDRSGRSARIPGLPGAENLAEMPAANDQVSYLDVHVEQNWQRSYDPQDEVSTTSNSIAEASSSGNLADVVRRQEVVIASLLGRCQALEDQYLNNQQKLAEFEQAHADATGRCAVVEAKLMAVQAEKDVDGRIGESSKEETRALCERLQNELASLKAQAAANSHMVESGSSSTTLRELNETRQDQAFTNPLSLSCGRIPGRGTKPSKNNLSQKPPKIHHTAPSSQRGSKNSLNNHDVTARIKAQAIRVTSEPETETPKKGSIQRHASHGTATPSTQASSAPSGQAVAPRSRLGPWAGESRQANSRAGSTGPGRQGRGSRFQESFDQKTARKSRQRSKERSKVRMPAPDSSEAEMMDSLKTPEPLRQAQLEDDVDVSHITPQPCQSTPRMRSPQATARRETSGGAARRETSIGRKSAKDIALKSGPSSRGSPQAGTRPQAGTGSFTPAYQVAETPPRNSIKTLSNLDKPEFGDSCRFASGPPKGRPVATPRDARDAAEEGQSRDGRPHWRTGPPMYAGGGRSTPSAPQATPQAVPVRRPSEDSLYMPRNVGAATPVQRQSSLVVPGIASREDVQTGSGSLESFTAANANNGPYISSDHLDAQEAGPSSYDGSLSPTQSQTSCVVPQIVGMGNLSPRVDKSQIEMLKASQAAAAAAAAAAEGEHLLDLDLQTSFGLGGHASPGAPGHAPLGAGDYDAQYEAPMVERQTSMSMYVHAPPQAGGDMRSGGLAASLPVFPQGGPPTSSPAGGRGDLPNGVGRQTSASFAILPPSANLPDPRHASPPFDGHASPSAGGHASPAAGGHSSPMAGGYVSPSAGGYASPGAGGYASPGAGGGYTSPAAGGRAPLPVAVHERAAPVGGQGMRHGSLRNNEHPASITVYQPTASGHVSPRGPGIDATALVTNVAWSTPVERHPVRVETVDRPDRPESLKAVAAGLSQKAIQVMGPPPPVAGRSRQRQTSVTLPPGPPAYGISGPPTPDEYPEMAARQVRPQEILTAQQVSAWPTAQIIPQSPTRFIKAAQEIHNSPALPKVPVLSSKEQDVQAALVRVMSRNAIHDPGTKPGVYSAQISPRGTSLEPRQGATSVPYPASLAGAATGVLTPVPGGALSPRMPAQQVQTAHF